jgi:hypothetical protein
MMLKAVLELGISQKMKCKIEPPYGKKNVESNFKTYEFTASSAYAIPVSSIHLIEVQNAQIYQCEIYLYLENI